MTTEPRLSHASEEAGREWFDDFAACVRTRDPEAARRLFDPACSSFGARADHLVDLDDLVARQWNPTWTTTRGFAAVPGTVAVELSTDATVAVLTARWTSEGVRSDGSTFARRGRCTVVLREHHGSAHGLVAVHTHFSLSPETDVPASS